MDLSQQQDSRGPGQANLNVDNYIIKVVENGKSKVACRECGKSYTTAFNLKSHIKINHFGIKEYECDICKQQFGRRETMKTHQTLVHGIA